MGFYGYLTSGIWLQFALERPTMLLMGQFTISMALGYVEITRGYHYTDSILYIQFYKFPTMWGVQLVCNYSN